MAETVPDTAERAILLFGTDETVAPMRRLQAGALTAELDRGNVRYIRWGGFEVLRAIAFVIRDTGWGTYDPVLSGMEVLDEVERFTVRYAATVVGAEGSFRYTAEIAGSSDGVLSFHADGTSDDGFATNRTGFVVLHPLDGVVGREIGVEHASGGRSTARFPELIDPKQPVVDIRSLRHEPMPGLAVTVRMEGDTFETEDHRNWTDASFKTYVRPLALGFPYRIAAGEVLDQRVTLTVQGLAPTASPRREAVSVRLGERMGTMPAISLFVPGAEIASGLRIAEKLAALRPSFVVARVDGRGDLAELSGIAELTRSVGRPLALDIVIDGKTPATELAPVAEAIAGQGLVPEAVFVIPARDLRGRPANSLPPGEAGPATILAAARGAFPRARIGGGMPVGFPELNRNRPPPGIDFITHATQATVHAADDVSVMETLEALPDVIRSARAVAAGVPYRLGLATIGAPVETYSAAPARNPNNRRMTQAANDPRQRGLFAAAFAVGYAAAAAGAGVDRITLAACSGSAGLFGGNGRAYPLAAVFRGLAALAGCPRIRTKVEGETKVAALAAESGEGSVLWLANLTGTPVDARIEDGAFKTIWRMDADALAEQPADEIAAQSLRGGAVRLDAYAVSRLS